MSLASSLPFKLNLDQIPQNPELYDIYFSVQALAYYTAKYAGQYQELATSYPQLGVENINTNVQRFYCQAGGAINPGDLVTFANSGGTTVVANQAKANSLATGARGIYLGSTALALNAWAEFIISPTILTTVGLTPGALYYLSPTVAGAFTITRPVTAGQIIQQIGYALSPTQLFIDVASNSILL